MSVENSQVASLRLPVLQALNWESEAVTFTRNDHQSRVCVWEAGSPVMVFPSGYKVTKGLLIYCKSLGWDTAVRMTGGTPVPQKPGVVNVSIVYYWPNAQPFSLQQSYTLLASILSSALNELGVSTEIGRVEGSYCDGTFNLKVGNKKIVGTAQRIIKGEQGYTVLAHAFILVDGDSNLLVNTVNSCYQFIGQESMAKEDSMQTLSESLSGDINSDDLVSQLSHHLSQAAIQEMNKFMLNE